MHKTILNSSAGTAIALGSLVLSVGKGSAYQLTLVSFFH
jgi:hypothetical protein